MSTDASKLSLGVRKVLQALDSPTAVKFIEKPLTDAVEQLAKQQGIRVEFDREALHTAGIPLDAPMTKSFSRDVTLDSVLRLMLVGDLDLAYLIRNDGLLITTEPERPRLVRQGGIDPAAYPMPRKAAATRRLAGVLKKTGSLSVTNKPLGDALDVFAATYGCNIQRDGRRMNDAGVQMDVPCTVTVKNFSLDSALRQLLTPLGLTYVIRDEVVLITTAATAKPAAPKANEPSKESFRENPVGEPITYACRVTDNRSGLPVAGAEVTVLRRVSSNVPFEQWPKLGETRHKTDAEGRYTFTVPLNQFAEKLLYLEFTVDHPDYVRYFGCNSFDTIRKNEMLGSLPFFRNIGLEPAEKISGTVVTPDGKPAAGMEVGAFSLRNKHDLNHPSWGDGTTDKEGRFELKVTKGGEAVFWLLPEHYSPSTHLAHAKRGDFGRFVLEKGLVLKGRVVDVDGKPLPKVCVNAEIRSGPAKQAIGMPVLDQLSRSAVSDQNGEFRMAPLPAGGYDVIVADRRRGGLRRDTTRYPLPAVFVNRQVTLDPKEPTNTIEVRAVSHVMLEGRFVDSSGKPTTGLTPSLSAWGFRDKTCSWWSDMKLDQQGRFVAQAPKGFQIKLSLCGCEHYALRTRVAKDAPLTNKRDIALGTIDHDKADVTVVRYKAPVLLIKAVMEDGKTIHHFQAKLKYKPGREPTGEYIENGKLAGDVSFAHQDDGRWRSEQLLPDEEFTVTVSAAGYEPKVEKLKLPEGAVKELVVRLKKKA